MGDYWRNRATGWGVAPSQYTQQTMNQPAYPQSGGLSPYGSSTNYNDVYNQQWGSNASSIPSVVPVSGLVSGGNSSYPGSYNFPYGQTAAGGPNAAASRGQGAAQPPPPSNPVTTPAPKKPLAKDLSGADVPEGYEELFKAVKFLVAAQLSKFLPLPKYFDNNYEEFVKCAKHLIDRVYTAEKTRGGREVHHTRRMQEGAIRFVNAYMKQYAIRKEQKKREMRKRKAAGTADGEKKTKKWRKKMYGDADLVGTPFVPQEDYESIRDASEERNERAEEQEPEDEGEKPASVKPPTQSAKRTPAAKVPPPLKKETLLKASSQTQELPAEPEPILFSSQPPRNRMGVRVDYGYDEEEIVDISMSDASSEPNRNSPGRAEPLSPFLSPFREEAPGDFSHLVKVEREVETTTTTVVVETEKKTTTPAAKPAT
ncbi:hypothetical protein DIPPA_30277 [Diplonema papillatum]|nr:hypothetical protein DIPPA_30277 [Diplonema papillatum]